ncbi:hypothetical protein HY640_03200 [Candidatus Woesearchaeota archaeon]|nr:hypothetical protein [Candidatus Woesearchaeota archaeon]
MRRVPAGSAFRGSLSLLKRRKWLFISCLFVVLLLSSLGLTFKGAVFVVALSLTAGLSTYYRRYTKLTIGFETVTFATVLTAVAYGPLIGSIVGLVSSFAAEFIPQLIDPSSFLWILSYPVVALVCSSLFESGVSLFWVGFVGSFIQNVIAEPIRIFSGDEYLRTMGVLGVTGSTVFNIILFRTLASPLYAAMG